GCDAVKPSAVISKPRLVWIHSRGLFGPWDAPLALQESLLDPEEGDPPPFEEVQPPDLALGDLNDPDARYAISCAYAAPVMVLDGCIDAIDEFLSQFQGNERWLTVLIGSRGFALGEHGHVGGGHGRLHAETLHVPMLWRFPDRSGSLARSERLASQLDLNP